MRTKGNKEITLIYYGKRSIGMVMKGTRLVWQAISSCFGSGAWNESAPWSESEAWKE